jgi:glucosyl-dolichyl phosphate glucuronosyltransferase
MKITAAICTYNREKYLPKLFDSIVNQTLDREKFEVLVIDNNSPGNTKEITEEFIKTNPNIEISYYKELNQGLSFSRNRAIQESTCELITFIDDDAFLDPDYLNILVGSFVSDTKLVALGGKILLHYESVIPAWENKYLNSLLGYYDKGNNTFVYSKSTKDYPRGSNMAFRKALFDQVGPFNVKLGRVGGNLMGGEEKELFDRIFSDPKNKVVYFPEALIWHSVPLERTTKEFIVKQALGTGRSERLRTSNQGTLAFTKRCGIEFLKYMASIALWIIYLFKGQISKGNMIIVFRFWVTKGLLLKPS